jgi:hypothetical protein
LLPVAFLQQIEEYGFLPRRRYTGFAEASLFVKFTPSHPDIIAGHS